MLIHLVRIIDALQTRVNWFLVVSHNRIVSFHGYGRSIIFQRLSYGVIFAGFFFVAMCISAAGAANAPVESQYRGVHSANTAAAVSDQVYTASLSGSNSSRHGPNALLSGLLGIGDRVSRLGCHRSNSKTTPEQQCSTRDGQFSSWPCRRNAIHIVITTASFGFHQLVSELY